MLTLGPDGKLKMPPQGPSSLFKEIIKVIKVFTGKWR